MSYEDSEFSDSLETKTCPRCGQPVWTGIIWWGVNLSDEERDEWEYSPTEHVTYQCSCGCEFQPLRDGSGVVVTRAPKQGRPRKNPVQVDENGQEYFEVVVMAQGNTGRVYPPKDWIGYRVRVTKLG